MIYAGILAGGKGTRMGNVPMPKQFLNIDEKPIIIHTIEKFLLNNKIDKILVASPKEWVDYTNELLKKYKLEDERIDIVVGGKERNETIMNLISHAEKEYSIGKKDIIITHDAVRPFLTHRIIEDNIKFGLKHDAVDTVVEAVDTIVKSENNETISEIPIRSQMYLGQTPQTFNIMKLKNIYETISEKEKEILTDACKMFLLKNKDVHLVKGENFNIKVTTPFDLSIANAIVKEKINK